MVEPPPTALRKPTENEGQPSGDPSAQTTDVALKVGAGCVKDAPAPTVCQPSRLSQKQSCEKTKASGVILSVGDGLRATRCPGGVARFGTR